MIDCSHLAGFLTERFGLPVIAEQQASSEGKLIIIRPDSVAHTNGFSIEVVVGWRSIEAKFLLGDFASILLNSIATATENQKNIFRTFSQSIIANGGSIRFVVGEVVVDPMSEEDWPAISKSFKFSFRKGALIVTQENENDLLYSWISRFFGAIVSLLPIEEEAFDIYSQGEKEGASKEDLVKRYERSMINRAACIEIHGLRCKVCNMHFEEVYGEIGEGFIHIHHVIPVSLMAGQYVVDPKKDLIPVCPNCHAMLHRQTPPLNFRQLKAILSSKA